MESIESLTRGELLWVFDCIANDILKNWELTIAKKLFEAEKRAPPNPILIASIDKEKAFEIILQRLTA